MNEHTHTEIYTLFLTRLSVVYARKHSSRHKVKRLVYYFRYVAMWSYSEILDHKVICLDKGWMRDIKKNKKRSRVIDIIEYVVFWFISLSQTYSYWSIASRSHSPFAQGIQWVSRIYIFEMNRWRDWSFHIYTIIASL